MIYLFYLDNSYKNIIDTLKINYDFINIIIIKNYEELFQYIIDNNLLFSKKIFMDNISEEYIKKILLFNKNLYILNTRLLINDDLSYLVNYNINVIDYNELNIKLLEKYVNVKYLPILINNNLIKNNDKIYDILTIINKNINCIDYNEDILKYKILVNVDDDNLDNHILLENLISSAICNNIIVISNKKKILCNNFLKDYVIDIPNNLINKYASLSLQYYNKTFFNIYKNFDLEDIKKNIKTINDNTFKEIIDEDKIGFILIRNINSEITNKFWIESYNCIRKFYKNKIIIIDDNSNYDYITEIELINCNVIKSEFKGRGEILAYYYYYKYNFFEKAIILHDSVFINKYINFDINSNIKFIWHFMHDWDDDTKELELLNEIENKSLKNNLIKYYHQKTKWVGCFGLQTVIKYDFLKKIVDKYKIFDLLEFINNRPKRMNFERIFGLICSFEDNSLEEDPSLFGIIHHYIHWGYTFDSYQNDKNNKIDHLHIVKTWYGR